MHSPGGPILKTASGLWGQENAAILLSSQSWEASAQMQKGGLLMTCCPWQHNNPGLVLGGCPTRPPSGGLQSAGLSCNFR